MSKPVLVIMAAGMGSRYGGLKQIDPMDKEGHILADFSIFDAKRAGFKKIIFIIKRQDEQAFRAVIGDRIEKQIDVAYAYQDMDVLPGGHTMPQDRVKPWGTVHAIMSAAKLIDGPFAVINSDDYYGVEAFKKIYDFLDSNSDDDKYSYAMVGYSLKNAVTDSGSLTRGVCKADNEGFLKSIWECRGIEKHNEKIEYPNSDGQGWVELEPDTLVSMNLWGFTGSILSEAEKRFSAFLDKELDKNPLKCEYVLPDLVGELLDENLAKIAILTSKDKWYGVTYQEDKPMVVNAMQKLKDDGIYPQGLWK